jgi:cytochrome P450
MLANMAKDRLTVMTTVAAQYGDAVKLRLGPKALHFFNHPDHAKHILVDNPGNYTKGIGLIHAKRALGNGLLTSEGDLWKAQRKVIQPVFQAKRISGKADVIAQEAAAMAQRLRAHAGREPLDIREQMTQLALGVLGRSLLEADLGQFDTMADAFEAVQDQAIFEMMTLSTIPTWVPLPKQLKFRKARNELDHIVAQLAAERGSNPTTNGDDILTRLLQANTTDPADPANTNLGRMRDDLITLLLAGHDTTASTLSWTFHLLDQHPHIWQNVHDEAVAVLGDRTPTLDDLYHLKYTSQVIQEVMRLYPAVWLLPRIATEQDTITGWHVPAGADVVLCPYTLHRHPEFWDHPDTFDPTRFDPGKTASRPRYAYIPFGAGPRVCVGSTLGLMEATIVIATITRDLRLTTTPGHHTKPEPMLTLRQAGTLPMHITLAR